MRPNRRAVLMAGGALAAANALPGTVASADPADPWHQAQLIRWQVRPPSFPRRSYDITRFGAAGNGTTDCTEAFRQAIAECHVNGGGRVLVPPGRYLTGPIHLRSNVNLHVSEGATVLFKTDPAAYLPVVLTRWEGTECYNYSPFVYALDQHDIAITGRGTLDGQAPLGPWESWYRSGGGQSADQQALRRMGNEGVPVAARVFGAGHFLRPNMIQLYRCRNVLISDVTILEPAMWTVHPVLCTNVTVRDITVASTLFNTDGCDPECCANVLIAGCRFNTNDDCVAVKAGRDEDGHRVGVPSQNILVEDCLLSGRWGGITVGSEMSGGVRNVFARRCVINSPDFPGNFPVKYPLYIKTNKLRGGFVENVHLRHFSGGGVEREAIFINMAYNNQAGTRPVVVRDISVEKMTIDGARAVLNLVGLETDHMSHIRLSNSTFTNVRNPNTIQFVDDLVLHEVTINGQPAEGAS
ncbi:MAG TPA: glycoside hydrolase family 28 protein [Actinophytocola sp.]|uniref:glycoside hydrolase family 28 protein n=1 Tax=Actinophytocola sp. TaxID=1872138 RepID=UPI002DDCA440|nr:glycoside hydrolase family 28 protein [Actinophytocola sp.]HEV2781595.1 glycoside hydrolase family 28 protein [Actinophytocola sp.]